MIADANGMSAKEARPFWRGLLRLGLNHPSLTYMAFVGLDAGTCGVIVCIHYSRAPIELELYVQCVLGIAARFFLWLLAPWLSMRVAALAIRMLGRVVSRMVPSLAHSDRAFDWCVRTLAFVWLIPAISLPYDLHMLVPIYWKIHLATLGTGFLIVAFMAWQLERAVLAFRPQDHLFQDCYRKRIRSNFDIGIFAWLSAGVSLMIVYDFLVGMSGSLAVSNGSAEDSGAFLFLFLAACAPAALFSALCLAQSVSAGPGRAERQSFCEGSKTAG